MEQFGRYQLTRRIGSGGMAEVFLARTEVAQGLSKQLVIKKIHPAFARSRQFAAMFVDEARVCLGLNHPNIVQVFDFGQIGDSWYLAMEYVEGLDLLRLEHEAGRRRLAFPETLAAYLVQQIAKGLDYAHRKTDDEGEPLGIVHRDVSPQNVLVSLDGAVKLTDFGIARARDVHDEAGVVKGKFAYMAPEQARGEVVDRRADVFSAGVVLFELITGQPLYAGKGKEALEQVRSSVVPQPRKLNPAISPALEAITLRALTFDREQRYQTGRDLQHALGQFQFEHARERGGPVDSGGLAQFVAGVVRPGSADPAGRRSAPIAPRPRPPSAGPGEAAAAEWRDAREKKHVFVVEAKVTGGEALARRLGQRDADRVLDEFQGLARELAYKHDAYVHRSEDAILTLVVGLPVAAEDDASRAIRLALALIEALDGIGLDLAPDLRLAAGIQRGVALVRRRRGARFGYELSAATTSVARRLATEASGGDVLCGGAVYRVAQAEWNFEELTTIDLSPTDPGASAATAASEPVVAPGLRARVYRLRGAKSRSQRGRERAAGVLCSRPTELGVLRDAYRNALAAGRHRHLLVVGDEGIGKRGLVNAFLAGLAQDEIVVVRAVARAATSGVPLGLIGDLAREALAIPERADPRELGRRIDEIALRLPAERREEDAPLARRALALVLGLERADRADEDHRALLAQAAGLAERHLAAPRPLVVVLENFDRADDPSLQLVEDALEITAGRARPVVVLLTTRDDPRVHELARRAGLDQVRLDELDEAARLAFFERRFAAGEQVRELARHVLSRTGGNPFFINETIDALIDRGVVRAEPGGLEVGKLRWVKRDVALGTPTTVEAVLVARIDQLPTPEKEALIHGAVLGRRFEPAALAELLGRPVDDALARLVERRMLERDLGWRVFKNEHTMTVAYGLVPEEERRELHRTAARQALAAAGYRPGRDDAAVARHLEQAGDHDAAADRYLAAAGHTAEQGAGPDALRMLARVLKLAGPDDHARRFAARALRESVQRRLGRRPAQLRELDGLRREAEALGDPARRAQAAARQAQFYLDVRRPAQARKAAAPALELAHAADDRAAEAEALRLHAEIAVLEGQGAEALALTDQALALAAEPGREAQDRRAAILKTRGAALWILGRLREAIEVDLESLVIYRALGLPRLEARSLNNLGVVFVALGEPEQALAYYKSALKLDQEHGDREAMALVLGNIGECYTDLGDLERGERYLDKAIELAEQQGDGRIPADLLVSSGQVAAARGSLDAAIARFERGLESALEVGDRYQEVRALTYLALAELDDGQPAGRVLDRARAAAAKAHEVALTIGEIFAVAVQGLALARLGRADEGAELTRAAVAMQAARQQPEGAEQILWFHARVCDAAGRADDARAAATLAWAEVESRAARLSAELRATYLASRIPRAIAAMVG
jgi:tetratricopeptide (TPR) repeat protein